ncbi:putative membrane protein insertion efficiency factor [Alphaproteobacteria bacterium]|nr:putative membrane protein insertion efficiency factor [Alphaproteobacteria bacterium]
MRKIAIILIRFYQLAISPHLKSQCKFYPTCSEYAILSIEKFGLFKGMLKTFTRLIRCNPTASGGIDFP